MSYVAWTEFRCDSFMCRSRMQYEGDISAATRLAREDGWVICLLLHAGRKRHFHHCPKCADERKAEEAGS